jgi:hypothetical protein
MKISNPKEDITKGETCIVSKITKKPFKSSTRQTLQPFELLHTDIVGSMRIPTAIEGHIYVINFIDDKT